MIAGPKTFRCLSMHVTHLLPALNLCYGVVENPEVPKNSPYIALGFPLVLETKARDW